MRSIIIFGPPMSGKSQFARRLSKLEMSDNDIIILDDLPSTIFNKNGEPTDYIRRALKYAKSHVLVEYKKRIPIYAYSILTKCGTEVFRKFVDFILITNTDFNTLDDDTKKTLNDNFQCLVFSQND